MRNQPLAINAKDQRTPELLNRINAKLNPMGLRAAYVPGSKAIEISEKINRADGVSGERLQWFVQVLHGENASATQFVEGQRYSVSTTMFPTAGITGVTFHLLDVYSTNNKGYLDNFAKDRDKIIKEIQQEGPYYGSW